GGEAETGPCPRRGLEEQRHHHLALEVVALLLAARADLDELLGRVEDDEDFFPAQFLQPQQVPSRPVDGFALTHCQLRAHGKSPCLWPPPACCSPCEPGGKFPAGYRKRARQTSIFGT